MSDLLPERTILGEKLTSQIAIALENASPESSSAWLMAAHDA
jgi:hypothetical protein